VLGLNKDKMNTYLHACAFTFELGGGEETRNPGNQQRNSSYQVRLSTLSIREIVFLEFLTFSPPEFESIQVTLPTQPSSGKRGKNDDVKKRQPVWWCKID
jgi:hypothetical protein